MKGAPRKSTFSQLTSAPLSLATHSELRMFPWPEQPVLVARAWLAVTEQGPKLHKSFIKALAACFPFSGTASPPLPFPGALSRTRPQLTHSLRL